jgi:hypothetical protein
MGHTTILISLKRRFDLQELKQLQELNTEFRLEFPNSPLIKKLGNSVYVDLVADFLKYLIN